MAEPDNRQQNQAFLQQLERQRLQKTCLRDIDLRGKVAGECQAYQIGDRTHYLDDRSYLLIKTLLEHSHNQFTVAVYEAWQKALQQLMQQDAVSKKLFIQRALRATERHFFNCHLQPIQTTDGAATADLHQQLAQLRRHNNHKVKQIRETLNSLFAIGQLTDIIASQYS